MHPNLAGLDIRPDEQADGMGRWIILHDGVPVGGLVPHRDVVRLRSSDAADLLTERALREEPFEHLVSLTQVRAYFTRYLDQLAGGQRIVVERNGDRVAVMLSLSDYERLIVRGAGE